jgi:hypothetical protein
MLNEFQIFFFIVLPTAITIMGVVLFLSVRAPPPDNTSPPQADTFEELSDGE